MSQKHKFWHPVRVRYVEVDSQRHVFFGHYLTYFDVSLVEYLRAIGHSYSSMVSSGVDMLYVHADCDYHGRARFDDLLHVHARIGDFGNTSLTFEFAIYGQPADELIATGSWNACKEKGTLRLEGKDYVMQDGDVVNFRFNV